MSYRRISEMYNIPCATLHDHVSGKVRFGARSGPVPYLNIEEEEELASFLIHTARIGFPHTKKQVFAIVEQILCARAISASVTNGWWERYLQRHPQLTLKSAVSLGLARAKASDPEVFCRYFDMLFDCLTRNDILDKPECIFNCDETGLAFNPPCFKVVGRKGSALCHVTSGDKSKATVLAFVGATGIAYPPMVIFGLKTFNCLLSKGEVPGTSYALSDKSWINSEVFQHWFEEHFLKYLPKARPVLLLLDGHSSHYSPVTIKIAAENQVILFALPPHTTHVSQPLDRCCFAPLKAAWRQECHNFYTENPGRCVTKYDFSHLFHKAWDSAMTGSDIVSGFKATGICPFDRNVITFPSEEESFSKFKPESLVERTGISYIPLYSPAPARTKSIVKEPAVSRESSFTKSVPTNPATYNSSIPTTSSVPLPCNTTISKFLPEQTNCNKLPTKHGKSAGTVLTDWEYRKILEEKERLKKEKLEEKQKKKEEREERVAKKKEEREERAALRAEASRRKQGTCMYCVKLNTMIIPCIFLCVCV